MSPDLSKHLNPKQWEAVQCTQGPLLLLAGAGSGKTRGITYRIAHILLQKKALPSEILAVTFTNKAVKEMQSRIYSLLNEHQIPLLGRPWVNTFHSLCTRILRDHIELLGYEKNFAIYDEVDQLTVIKKILKKLNWDEKKFPPKEMRLFINSMKRKAILPQEVEKKAPYINDEKINFYTEYESDLKRSNGVDFGGLLLNTYILFTKHPEVLEIYQKQFKYVTIDEFQDTNFIQYEIIKSICKKNQNLCVVGDEDQCIYGWRGANVYNILNFEKDFKDVKVIKFEQNYRSSKKIVNASSCVIRNNTQRKDKVLFTEREEGEKLLFRNEQNENLEARFVANEIKKWVESEKGKYKDCSIFYRTNAQSRTLEDHLRSLKIPYKIVGGIRFYDRAEIKDVTSYMKLISNPKDDVALKRIINSPPRGLGKRTLEKIEEHSNQNHLNLLESVRELIVEKKLPSRALTKLTEFYKIITDLVEFQKTESVSSAYFEILERTSYIKYLEEDESIENQSRINNLEEFSNVIAQFEEEREQSNIQDFLEEVSLASGIDEWSEGDDMVTLMTLHLSKGLEFPYVFITGCEEGLLPSIRDHGEDEEEEERRLIYVGMTRAQKKLTLTFCHERRVWGQMQQQEPSRFLKEIPEEYVQFENGFQSAPFESCFNDPFPEYEEDPSYSQESDFPLKKGTRVRHPIFGVGKIVYIEGKSEDQKVQVKFGNQEIKTFIIQYARLEVI